MGLQELQTRGLLLVGKKGQRVDFWKKRQWKRRDVVMPSYGKYMFCICYIYIYILSYNGAVMLWQLLFAYVDVGKKQLRP